jgi:hypothetical protein
MKIATLVRLGLVLIILFFVGGFLLGRASLRPEIEILEAKSSHWEDKLYECRVSTDFREYVITKCLDSYSSRVGEPLPIHLEDFIKDRIETELAK